MTNSESNQYFHYHNRNIKSLKTGFDEIRNLIKELYRKQNKNGDLIYSLPDNHLEKLKIQDKEIALSRVLSGIQVSWAEESIKRLLYEDQLLTDNQRTYLLKLPALDQRWLKSLKIVFCIAYDLVPHNDELCETVRIQRERNNLGDDLVDLYLNVKRVITDHLVPNFSIRNKVQHGEWLYAFKPKYSEEFSQSLTDKVNYENIVTTTSRYTIVNALYQMLVDLGRFRSDSFKIDSISTPFEYFSSNYSKKIKFEVSKIQNVSINDYIDTIVEKAIRGRVYRRDNR